MLPPTSGHLWPQGKDSDLVLDAYKDSGSRLSIFGVITCNHPNKPVRRQGYGFLQFYNQVIGGL